LLIANRGQLRAKDAPPKIAARMAVQRERPGRCGVLAAAAPSGKATSGTAPRPRC